MMTVPTKGHFERQVRQWSGWIAAALAGAGLALTISIVFLAPGVVLLALGVGIAVLGRLLTWVVAFILPHRSLECPHCHQVNQVFNGSGSFRCDACLRDVATAEAIVVPQLVPDEPATVLAGRRMLILFAALSFIAFFVEIYLGHYSRLQLFRTTMTVSAALVPLFFTPIALVVCLVAAARLNPSTVRVFNLTMLASIAVGIGGTYFHVAARITSAAGLLNVTTWLGDPPAFAPFAFALPGIMGLVATYGIRWTHRLPQRPTPYPAAPQPASPRADRS